MKINSLVKYSKGLIISMALMAAVGTAHARWFNVETYANVTNRGVQVGVSNNSAYPWVCSGHVYGMTQYGQTMMMPINNLIVPAGQYRTVTISTWGNAVPVQADTNMQCSGYV